ISLIQADGTVQLGTGAYLGRAGLTVASDTIVRNPYLRAIATMRPTASVLVDRPIGRRVLIFDPVVSGDSSTVRGVVVGELDPGGLLRAAIARGEDDPESSAALVSG